MCCFHEEIIVTIYLLSRLFLKVKLKRASEYYKSTDDQEVQKAGLLPAYLYRHAVDNDTSEASSCGHNTIPMSTRC